jgi:hypothetical protein
MIDYLQMSGKSKTPTKSEQANQRYMQLAIDQAKIAEENSV